VLSWRRFHLIGGACGRGGREGKGREKGGYVIVTGEGW
jgi:hypothetical protein